GSAPFRRKTAGSRRERRTSARPRRCRSTSCLTSSSLELACSHRPPAEARRADRIAAPRPPGRRACAPILEKARVQPECARRDRRRADREVRVRLTRTTCGRQRMNAALSFGIAALLIGAGATLFMDMLAALQKHLLGVRPLNYALVGRW